MKSTLPLETTSTHARSTNRPGQAAPLREPADQPSPGRSRRGKRILLVDDDPTVRDSLNDVLLAEGYVVTSSRERTAGARPGQPVSG